jgi:hypothetical protein
MSKEYQLGLQHALEGTSFMKNQTRYTTLRDQIEYNHGYIAGLRKKFGFVKRAAV